MGKNKNLEETGNRMPFSVPENYFEQFATQFESQIVIERKLSMKILRPWMYMAAMFLGVLFLSRIVYTVYNDNKLEATENYELYVMTQVNDVENMEYTYQEINEK